MNAKKKKIIVLMFVFLLLIILLISLIIGINNDKGNQNVLEENNTEKYVYDFGEILDLESDRGFEEYATNGTDYPSLGIISDFYEGVEVTYHDDKITMQTYEGMITVSASWMDEGKAKYIKQPEFGALQKFVLKKYSIAAIYADTTMKETITYINELAGLGYNNVVLDEKNKKDDYYYYSAKNKDGITVTLNYEKDMLYIEVF